MGQLIIKEATLHDVPTLCRIGAETFLDTYSAQNTPEHLAEHLERVFNEATVSAQFSQPDFAPYIAWLDDEPIGYIQLRNTEHPPELADKRHIELERIYVRTAYKRAGYGRQLLQHAIETSRRKGFEVLWLGVWEENPRAIAFYIACGCVAFGKHIFWLGSDPQQDILLKVEL